MVMQENLWVAFQCLKSNPLRSILTFIGIAVGIGAVLYVVILGEITQRRINERLQSLGSNVLIIRPGYSRHGGVRTSSSVVNLTWDDAREIEEASSVISVTVPTFSGSSTAEYRDKNWSTRVTGTTPVYADVNNSNPIEGRFFNESEMVERSQVCVLGETVRKELFGDQSPVGETILVKAKRFEVIGLLEAKGESWSNPDDQIFIPLTTAQERMFGSDHLGSILAQLQTSEDYDESLFDIEQILRRNHRLREDQGNDFRVRRQDFFLSTIQGTNEDLADFIVLIALVSLFVGAIGIANVMLVSVTERVREIGIRRAVGANRLTITIQFLTEAVILGMVGGMMGIVGGIVINHMSMGEEIILPWIWIFNSLLICVGIGIIAGLYPAIRAANVNVIEALHHE
ncbi:MAG: ABC transporter permease [candidate division Zixibacteria bacterium]